MTVVDSSMNVHATCDWCGEPLGPTLASAPHKRFCCTKHRLAWHSKRRNDALRALARQASPEAEAEGVADLLGTGKV